MGGAHRDFGQTVAVQIARPGDRATQLGFPVRRLGMEPMRGWAIDPGGLDFQSGCRSQEHFHPPFILHVVVVERGAEQNVATAVAIDIAKGGNDVAKELGLLLTPATPRHR
jgi:hypothetical protein